MIDAGKVLEFVKWVYYQLLHAGFRALVYMATEAFEALSQILFMVIAEDSAVARCLSQIAGKIEEDLNGFNRRIEIAMRVRVAILIIVLIISGCDHTAMGQHIVTNTIEPMRTYCFGRYLIDLPENFRLNYYASSATLYYGHDTDFSVVELKVVDNDVSLGGFLDFVERRSAEISAEVNEETKGPMLVSEEEIGESSVLLRYYWSSISSHFHTHELHALVSGTHVLLKADSYEGNIETVEARLKWLATRINPLVDPQMTGAGFCIGSVVIDADLERIQRDIVETIIAARIDEIAAQFRSETMMPADISGERVDHIEFAIDAQCCVALDSQSDVSANTVTGAELITNIVVLADIPLPGDRQTTGKLGIFNNTVVYVQLRAREERHLRRKTPGLERIRIGLRGKPHHYRARSWLCR